jgi:hypothetical protein
MKMISSHFGRPTTGGAPASAVAGAHAWRVRQTYGAATVPSLFVTDLPVNKPLYVSASERCP